MAWCCCWNRGWLSVTWTTSPRALRVSPQHPARWRGGSRRPPNPAASPKGNAAFSAAFCAAVAPQVPSVFAAIVCSSAGEHKKLFYSSVQGNTETLLPVNPWPARPGIGKAILPADDSSLRGRTLQRSCRRGSASRLRGARGKGCLRAVSLLPSRTSSKAVAVRR